MVGQRSVAPKVTEVMVEELALLKTIDRVPEWQWEMLSQNTYDGIVLEHSSDTCSILPWNREVPEV